MLAAVVLSLCAGLAPAEDPRDELLKGVEAIASPGHPGGVTVFGPEAWPLILGGRVPIAAAAEVDGGDGGRVLALTQGGYVQAGPVGVADTRRLLRNAMGWLSGGQRRPTLAAVGGGQCGLADALGLTLAEDWLEADVLVADSGNLKPHRLAAVREHLAGGGGAILGNTPWGWQQLTPKLDLARDQTLNRLMAPFGLAFDRRLSTDPGQAYPVGPPPGPMAHAGRAFAALARGDELEPSDRELARASVRAAIGALSDHEPSLMLPLRRLAGGGEGAFASELAGWLSAEAERRGLRPLGERWGPWQLVGPFPSGGFGRADQPLGKTLSIEKKVGEQIADSAGPDLAKEWKGRGWRSGFLPVELQRDGLELDAGLLEVDELLARRLDEKTRAGDWSRGAVAFLYRRIELDEPRSFTAELAGDGGLGIWLDGELLDAAYEQGAMARLTVELTLEPGVHHLWIKLAHEVGNWRFSMGGTEGVDQALVDAAIDRAAGYLIRRQHLDGSWTGHGGYGPGYTAMALYALAKSGYGAEHPVMRRGLAYLRAHEARRVYSLSSEVLALAALDRSAAPADFQPAVDTLSAWQGSTGLWAYPHSHEDLSNTLFAALALRAAAGRGARVDAEVWHELIEGALTCQERARGTTGKPPLGFSYTPGGNPTGSICVAGLSCLLIAAQALGEDLNRPERRRVDEAVARGLAWIDLHMAWRENPGQNNWHYFWIYGIERLGALLETATLGGVPWYPTGAEYLIESQHSDGHWAGGHPEIDTVLGLLFLSRATAPTSGNRTPDEWRLVGSADPGEPGRPIVRARLAAVAEEPLELWIESFGGAGAEAVEAVEWLARTPAGERVLARVERAQDRGLGHFAARLVLPSTEAFELIARAHTVDGTAESVPLSIPALYARADLENAADQARNLLRGAAAGASSSKGASKPSHAIDGVQSTNWIFEPADREPTWWVEVPSPEPATRLVLIHRGPSPQHAALSRVTRLRVTVNRRTELEVELDPDPMRATVVDLGDEVAVSRIELRPLAYTTAAESGFSEVLLLR